MKALEDTLARAADEVRHKVAQVPARAEGAARVRVRTARLVRLGALLALMLSLGAVYFILGPGSSPRGFVAPPTEPERQADVYILFPSDVDSMVGELTAAEVATWEGVEYASFWGPERTLQDFSELFADQPSLIAIVEQDPSVLGSSVRVWLTPDADSDALVERARQTFPDAVSVETRDERNAGVTTANGESAVTTIAVPTELETAGIDLQDEILADGKVSRDESVRAVARMAACMIEHGLTGVTWSVDASGGGWSGGYASLAGDERAGAGDTVAAAEEAIYHLCFYSYVNRVGQGLDRVGQGAEWGPTELAATVGAFLPVLEELDAQLLDLLNRATQIEYDWENREETFANTTNALNTLRADLESWATAIAGRSDIPSDLEAAYAALVDEASDLPEAAEAILLGVQAPDDGTQRKTALSAFVQEALDVVYAIDTLRRGG